MGTGKGTTNETANTSKISNDHEKLDPILSVLLDINLQGKRPDKVSHHELSKFPVIVFPVERDSSS